MTTEMFRGTDGAMLLLSFIILGGLLAAGLVSIVCVTVGKFHNATYGLPQVPP